MDIEQLTEKMHAFVQSKGWYSADSARPQTARNVAISLAIETAEILEHFQWGEEPSSQTGLAEELADVTLYLLQLASICKIDLEEAVLDKLKVNQQRVWDDGGVGNAGK